jgi:hypothetical protein
MALFQLRGSLRIGNGLGFGSANQAGLGETTERPPYTESLVKLFPAEGVGLTTLVVGLGSDLLPLSIVLTVVIAAGVFVLRTFATKPANGGKTDWWAVIIATISYFMYAVSVGAFSTFGNPQALATSMGVIIGVWTFVVPFFPTKS